MKKTYVLGATANGSRIFLVYKKALKNKLEILGTPIETNEFNGTFNERFIRAENFVKSADIIIADMSEVSTGAGIELGMAHRLNKPIYVFANKNVRGQDASARWAHGHRIREMARTRPHCLPK